MSLVVGIVELSGVLGKGVIVLSCEGRDEGLRFSSMEPVEVTVLFKEKKILVRKRLLVP